jgi:hypothetical protein
VKVVVLPGARYGRVEVVCGGSTRIQLAPFAWTQYHQLVELSVDAFHANETLVPELAVMWRFVGVVGACLSPGVGGRLPAAVAVRTSASTSAVPASVTVRMDIAPPGGAHTFHGPIRIAAAIGLPPLQPDRLSVAQPRRERVGCTKSIFPAKRPIHPPRMTSWQAADHTEKLRG